MIDDHEYWDNFYKRNGLMQDPSTFAQYVQNNHLGKRGQLLELGCGNGRDALYFAQNGLKVTALDFSRQTIENLRRSTVRGARFLHRDFSDLSIFSDFDYVYSRFTLHAVDEDTENRVFEQLAPAVIQSLTPKRTVFLQLRVIKESDGVSEFAGCS